MILNLCSKIIKTKDDTESEKLEQGIHDCISKMIIEREKEISGARESMVGGDFLGSLLEAYHDRDGSKRLVMQDMVDECKTFYFAGHETTTSLLGWTMLLLSTNKQWQEKARNEVVELFGQTNPTSDGIPRLKTVCNLKLY